MTPTEYLAVWGPLCIACVLVGWYARAAWTNRQGRRRATRYDLTNVLR